MYIYIYTYICIYTHTYIYIYICLLEEISQVAIDDGIAVAVLRGKIFFDQYRAMLLDICP
jgi:hypothetical protein